MSDIPMMPGLLDQRGEPMDTLSPPIKPKEKPCLDGKVKDAAGNCVDKPCNQFENRVKQVINAEGGFVDDPADSGGATNKGIAWKTWKNNAKSVLGVQPTLDNLKNLTDAQAKQIYRHTFWDAISADQINDGDVRYLLFDFYVNSGPSINKNPSKNIECVRFYLNRRWRYRLKNIRSYQ